ncbi:MAG TPA: amino acid ABC transporter permease [Burkholderiaceae bacterium]|nr:amino acid ABC transporter permease [Burkholderiaceae bacterium]
MAIFGIDTFCRDTIDKELIPNCLKSAAGDTSYLHWLLQGWGTAVALALLALVVAMFFGILMGILRTTPSKALVLLGDAWTELFRNVPLIVQLFLWYFVMPELIPPFKALPGFVLAFIGLGLFTSARISEQIKAGINALPRGQRYAGLAVGFTLPQTYRYVLLPMAFRIVIPPLTSESMNIIKNSSVAFAVSVSELTMFARQAGEETSQPVLMFMAVTLLYFVSAFVVNRILKWVEVRVRVPGMIGGK